MKDEKGGPMKELDFDELHEAVNKLMDQAQKPKAKREPAKSVAKAVTRPSVKVAERSAEKDSKDVAAVVEPKEDTGSAINVTVRKPAAKIAPKKRGMAMDVVQAAKPSAVAPPSARTARTAPTLQPTGPVRVEPPSPRAASAAPVASDESPKPSAEPEVGDDTLASLNLESDGTAKPKTIVEEHKSDFPDPLEVHGFTGGDEPAKRVAAPEAPATPLGGPTMAHGAVSMTQPKTDEEDPLLKEDDEAPAKNQWEMPGDEEPVHDEPAPKLTEAPADAAPAEPAATPFVNAKVEKRPLGAYSDAAPTPATAPQAAPAPEVPTPEERAEAASIETPAAPEELNPEIVAVESADVDYSQAHNEQEAPLNTLRQMAIPQQYHAGEKKSSKHDRPIFDTKDYHPPLQPVATAKHHTGSKAGAILTLILIILLVAAGVGAYFVATGSIDITRIF
ncbi:MAG TPA: hypothetical protein VJM32_05765 [Candidatus Saccharimonadales bacterium]|nr:hypothetical protein [Candidatus Saccharimonadales bacterium]